MLDRIEGRNGSHRMAVMLALTASVFFGLVLWYLERDLLWMLAVLLPPIWSPVIYQRYATDDPPTVKRVAAAAVLLGLVALFGVALLVYLIG